MVFSSTGGQLGHGRSKQSVSKQTVGQLLLELDEVSMIVVVTVVAAILAVVLH